ncbi:hypothetical protein CEXT_774711 [Caerostris extrusa]|uniref:Uncharacterized protein n=1 Tax=Caerostris extrusa TaxID=172846 RepID=A0AAV4VLP2_CAEEX|nr:hypothetical protein CEXT_774711 [Caerostris extrusa]
MESKNKCSLGGRTVKEMGGCLLFMERNGMFRVRIMEVVYYLWRRNGMFRVRNGDADHLSESRSNHDTTLEEGGFEAVFFPSWCQCERGAQVMADCE